MSYDPLPSISEIGSMIDVGHPNDKLAIRAIHDAVKILADGGSSWSAAQRIRNTRDFSARMRTRRRGGRAGFGIRGAVQMKLTTKDGVDIVVVHDGALWTRAHSVTRCRMSQECCEAALLCQRKAEEVK